MQKMEWKRLAIASALALGACDRAEKAVDPGRGGDRVLSGVLLLPDGKPAADAEVRLYAVDHVPGPGVAAKASAFGGAAYVTRTDAEGKYSVDSLGQGEYNILGELDGLVSYQDSVFLSPGREAVASGSLGRGGTVTAKVEIQPHHDSRSVTVHVLGTRAFANVDAEGRFTLRGMAAGTYSLRIATTEPGYTQLFAALAVRAGAADSLATALRPDFTGIPVVAGLEVALDTLAGVARISWSPAEYKRLESYVVYRQRRDQAIPVPQAIGATTDTFWNDTLYFPAGNDYGLAAGTFPAPVPWEYRVRIRNLSDDLGDVFGGAKLDAVPPSWVQTHLEFRTSGTDNGQGSLNDTVKVVALFRNKTRRLTQVVWREHGVDVVRSQALRAGTESGSDTLAVVGAGLGTRNLFCQVWSESGSPTTHPFNLSFVAMPPTAFAGKDTVVGRARSYILQGSGSTRIGRIIRWEWDVGAKGNFVDAPEGRMELIAPDTSITLTHILRVTNEDGEMGRDSVRVTVTHQWTLAGKVPFHGNEGQIVQFRGRFWQIGGQTPVGGNALFSSVDGLTWQAETPDQPAVTRRRTMAAFVHRDTLWVYGGRALPDFSGCSNDIWASVDALHWTRMGDGPLYEYGGCEEVKAVVGGGRVYLVGKSAHNLAVRDEAGQWKIHPTPWEVGNAGYTAFLGYFDDRVVIGTSRGNTTITSAVTYYTVQQDTLWNRLGTRLESSRVNPGWAEFEGNLLIFGGSSGTSLTRPDDAYMIGNDWGYAGKLPKVLGSLPTSFVHENRVWIVDGGDLIRME